MLIVVASGRSIVRPEDEPQNFSIRRLSIGVDGSLPKMVWMQPMAKKLCPYVTCGDNEKVKPKKNRIFKTAEDEFVEIEE